MKKMNKTLEKASICVAVVCLGFLIGCSALQTKPPTGVESAIYNVTTNWNPTVVTVTNQTVVTNLVPVFVTNTVAGLPVVTVVTNIVTVPGPATITTVTNLVPAQQFAVAAGTTSTIQAVGAGINTFAPGIGTLIASAVAGLLGLWGTLRSKQASTSQAVAANSVQAIEVARNLIAQLAPQAATQFNSWLISHQQDAGIANEAAAVVDDIVNTTIGQAAGVGAAQQILAAAIAPLPVSSAASSVVVTPATIVATPAVPTPAATATTSPA